MNTARLLSMCDDYLGRVLDVMDECGLWKDTMLIVTTDHGFLLGEHDWWAKNIMPFYNEIARTPLFVWDPREQRQDERCGGLTQPHRFGPDPAGFLRRTCAPGYAGHPPAYNAAFGREQAG